jgi:hypothetical protein
MRLTGCVSGLVSILLTAFLLASCTHKVFRKEYRFGVGGQVIMPAVISHSLQPDSATLLGRVELSDGWWVVECSEQAAVRILRTEAHQLKADVISVVSEKRPDFNSSCYRCVAEFYRLHRGGDALKQPDYYSYDAIRARTKKDRRRNLITGISAASIGILIGVGIGVLFLN